MVKPVPMVNLSSGLVLSYAQHGPGSGPAVVLLPGPTDSHRSYRPVLERLPDDLRTVAVSLRGHGESSKPATGYTVHDLASDVVPLLDALGIGRAVLAGHSGSCLVARRVALESPDRVAGLIFEASPTTLRNNPSLLDFVNSVVANLSDPIDRDFAESFIADTSTGGLAPQFVDLLVDDLLKVPVVAWREMFTSLLVYDDTAFLASISAPVLLVWGDADSLVPKQMQDELLVLLPLVALHTYIGVGHTPRWEQPDRFAGDVEAFASQVLR